MTKLPKIPHPTEHLKSYQTEFKGLNHTVGAADGEIYDMLNMSSDHDPVLSPRGKRRILYDVGDGRGVFQYNGEFFWVDGHDIYRDGEIIGTTDGTAGTRSFAVLGHKVLIFPDGIYIDLLDGGVGTLAASVTATVTFLAEDTYEGSAAERNALYCPNVNWADYFKEGDGVAVSGCTAHPANNKTAVIREIDGQTLRFYENCWEVDSEPAEAENGTAYTEYHDVTESGVTLARTVPAFEIICVVNNRLWGCVGNTIYGSKLGDPFNFNVFDGLATDSFSVETETDGDFTAAIGYNGYPMFFKENSIHKLYGDYPANFQLARQMQQGVKKGCGRTLAIAGEVLYYVAKNGVMAYSGGIPTLISTPLGKRIVGGVGVSDGMKYYISAACDDGSVSLYVYDAYRRVWHREDDLALIAAGNGDFAFGMTATKILSLSPGCSEGTEEAAFPWMVEFADMAMGSPFKKGVAKLNLRLDPSGGGRAIVEMMFDSNKVWQPVKTIDRRRKHSDILPIIPRRCDHFKIRIRGRGMVDIYALTIQYYQGSEHRGGVYNNG